MELAGGIGCTAVVTGAASGIGAATAQAFAARGYAVVAVDRDAEGLAGLAARCDGVRPVAGDVCDPGLPGEVGALLADLGGGLDVLANVAGNYVPASLSATTRPMLEELLAVHVQGPTQLTGGLLDELERASGAVVTMSSTFGHRASRTASAYAAAKAAVESLTRSWAIELAPRRIRVNCVAPGPTETPILARSGMTPEAVRAQRAVERRRVPLGRLGAPAEVASWVVALAENSWTTGQVISVDGGLSHE